MPAGFDPKPGSVSPKHPIASPALQFRKPALLLFLAAEGQDRIHHERALHANETAQPGIAALDLLHHQTVLDVAHPGAAVAFDIGAQKSQAPHLRDQFCGEARLTEAIADQRKHALIDELARGLPNQQLLLGKLRIDQQIVDAGKSGHARLF